MEIATRQQINSLKLGHQASRFLCVFASCGSRDENEVALAAGRPRSAIWEGMVTQPPQSANLSGCPRRQDPPGDQLDEVVSQADSGLGIHDGGSLVTNEVAGDNLILGVAQNALQLALRGGLEDVSDLLVGGALLQGHCQIDNGDVQGWHPAQWDARLKCRKAAVSSNVCSEESMV